MKWTVPKPLEHAHKCRWDMPMSNLGKPHLIKNIRELLITAQGEGLLRLKMITESAQIERTIRLREERRVYKVPMQHKRQAGAAEHRKCQRQ